MQLTPEQIATALTLTRRLRNYLEPLVAPQLTPGRHHLDTTEMALYEDASELLREIESASH